MQLIARSYLAFSLCIILLTVLTLNIVKAREVQVTVSIAPIHSLVAMVMADTGAPSLLVPAGTSPHHYSLKPSEARRLANADLVVWVGQGLEPWLVRPIGALAAHTKVLDLSQTPDMVRLRYRRHHVNDKERQQQASDKQQEHDDHAAHHEDDDHHDHEGAFDPHYWLDPDNAIVWLREIAATLSEIDPVHSAQYQDNAKQAVAEMEALALRLEEKLTPVQARAFAVFHDALQYFDTRFGLTNIGAIRNSDAEAPSAGRVLDLKRRMEAEAAVCIFSEPQFNAQLAENLSASSSIRHRQLDLLGWQLAGGKTLYPTLLERLADTIAECLQ